MATKTDRCFGCGHEYDEHTHPNYFTCFCGCETFTRTYDQYRAVEGVGTGHITRAQRSYEATGR